jgi:hypothetical protein
MPERPHASLIASIAANERWSAVVDRTAETAPARRAFLDRFPNENARRAYFQRMALKSAQARSARRRAATP